MQDPRCTTPIWTIGATIMNRNSIIAIGLVALAVVGLMFWGRATEMPAHSEPEAGPKSALSASENSFDFGTISMKDGNVAHLFKVANSTSEDIVVDRLSTSCMCTGAYLVEGASRVGPFGMSGMGFGTKLDKVFRAGETKDIEVIYDPNAHGPAGLGPMERFIHLTDASGGVLQLQIKGLVRP